MFIWNELPVFSNVIIADFKLCCGFGHPDLLWEAIRFFTIEKIAIYISRDSI